MEKVLQSIIEELSYEAGRVTDQDARRASLESGARVLALAAKSEFDGEDWDVVLRTCCTAAKGNSPMHPFFAKLTRPQMESCRTESLREVRMVAAWIRADLDANGTVSTKELAKLFKTLNIPHTSKSVRTLALKYSTKPSHTPDGEDDKSRDLELTFLQFRAMWKAMDTFPELEEVFRKHCERGKYTMTLRDLKAYLQSDQKSDNTMAEERARAIMTRYGAGEGLGQFGFVSFMINPEYNSVVNQVRTKEVYQDMTRPLHEYFIASSHNTYLTGHQLYGDSSPDMFKNALAWGCRCVEIDCWDGANGEPVVYHGYTTTSKISFESVIKAIHAAAFTHSDFPVILSLEVHTSIEQQKKMAAIMIKTFGETLHPAIHASTLRLNMLSPHALKGKILVKGKVCQEVAPPTEGSSDSELSDEKADEIIKEKKKQKKGKKGKHPPVARELSDVVFLVSVKVKDPADVEGCMPYDIVSMVEGRIEDISKDNPGAAAEMNKRMLTRVYPAGSRISSKNYDPQVAWNMGAQVVALNYQTQTDEHLRHYVGRFRDNGGCGYVLKPTPLRTPGLPFNEFTQDHLLELTILRAWRLPKPERSEKGEVVDPKIEILVSGVECDCVAAETPVVKNNGYNPVFNFTTKLRFRCLEMATLILRVCDDDDEVLAESVVPVPCLLEGLRCVKLWDYTMKPCNAGLLLKTRWAKGGPGVTKKTKPEASPALQLADVNVRNGTATPPPRASQERSPLQRPEKPIPRQEGGLMLGQVVHALWRGEQWRAKIVGRGLDSHFVVLFDDQSRATMHLRDLSELPPATHPQVPHYVGQKVLAAWGTEGWFPAVVSHINQDTSCAVEWEDNSGWNTVPVDYIRAG